ncbi:glycosyltransferase family 9 protein [Pedobacter sp. JY14-1]|uniref:glycosyltransferase family 9 protein n=1 Tax=Pedobacter sp. JY14-1 TaxID=3034151 RepID=UPI0023E1CF83|nr:glycosyltransferase family 9 protein [Pedobacter sp. JY14-1]
MAEKDKILIIRFSAMGDVAMTAPVVREFRENYPGVELVVVSRAFFAPFFKGIPGLHFCNFNPGEQHKGLGGIFRLYKTLSAMGITCVADLHDNLRSRILCSLFRFSGIRIARLDKGRTQKRRLTRKNNKILVPLKLTVHRYAEVFGKLGYPFTLKNELSKSKKEQNIPNVQEQKKIGISPFAQHQQKVYPFDKLERVLLELAEKGHQLFIFGGSAEEQQQAEKWEALHPGIRSTVRKMTLDEELKFISDLDLMLSMDSSGMHLASLQGIPVVSVWGATHPYAGFLGYGQSLSNAVQNTLYCRPCSVYGNIPCYRGDFACMNNLAPEIVIDRVIAQLNG